MKAYDISDILMVRKYGVRGAKMCARLWFPVTYFLIAALSAGVRL